MVSFLDCIKRVPVHLAEVIEKRKETYTSLLKRYEKNPDDICEIILIGSGTSNTACITARPFMEMVTGVEVKVITPNDFLHNQFVFNTSAIYVFVSQTGTSILTNEALQSAKELEAITVAFSESASTPIAKAADVFIDMLCGKEEYSMRTIGYSTSVLGLMLMGIEIGLLNEYLSEDEEQEHIEMAKNAVKNIPTVIDKALEWMEYSKLNMMLGNALIFYGSRALYGVALEGAIKAWEIPKIISIGYEMEEGTHGPNFGFTHNHSVIVLNDGDYDNEKAIALADYMRNEKNNGYIVGVGAKAKTDLSFEPIGGPFCCLEFASVVQVVSYCLAISQGRNLYIPNDNSVMERYFRSHSKPTPEK